MLHLPDTCVFSIPPSEFSPPELGTYPQPKLDEIWDTLNNEGIVLVHMPWKYLHAYDTVVGNKIEDSSRSALESETSGAINNAMLGFIQQLGGVVHSHNSGGLEEQVWDVRPFFDSINISLSAESSTARNGITSTCTNDASPPPPPRSHTADEFDMHTDCCFEDPPPRYVALYVVQEDQCGGGYSTLIDTEALNRYITKKSLKIFLTTDFTVSVPPEFYKGESSLKMKLITPNEKLWKYRSDIIRRDLCSADQLEALSELDSLLRNPSLVLTTMLPTGSLLIIDNMRWFHGRSAIVDKHRWLKRIRFHPSVDKRRPVLKRLVSRTDALSGDSILETTMS